MTKIKYALYLILLILFSFMGGYILHESKDQLEIKQEAEKIFKEKNTLNITTTNITICEGELNERYNRSS